jgi:multiple sugar transport system permease protein
MNLLKNKQQRTDFIFVMSVLIPIMVLFTIIRFIPILQTFGVSFFKKSMIRPERSFIGFENYTYILKDKEFIRSLMNTLFISFFSVTLSVVFGLFLAMQVNNAIIKGMKFWQAVLFIPVIVSMVPSTLMWKMLFDYNFGVVNYVLNVIGLRSIDWINNESIVRWPIVIVGIWKEMGYNMMIFFVGLKAVPHELYESADIDGATKSQKLWYITLPQIKPITLFITVMSFIKFIKVFTQAFVMTSGSQSSGNIFKTLVYYIYQQGFTFHSMGRASAASMVLLIIVFVLTWFQMRLSKD